MKKRIEEDAFGKVAVPMDRMWGAQTQRSKDNFPIGTEKMPEELITTYALVKKAAATTYADLGELDAQKAKAICEACDEIIEGEWEDEFPLPVWQTGSGTQTNMNLNEVIAHIANAKKGADWIHPNDDVNKGQSTNDTFPTAMHLSGALLIQRRLLPILEDVQKTLETLEEAHESTIKIGRTHLQDATPITFGQEISGWREMMRQNAQMIQDSLRYLLQLPIGGTAVGTGLNTHAEFAEKTVSRLAGWTKLDFKESSNKFHGLSSKDAFVHVHGALKALAANALKMANDIRWLASGPRSGLGEISIPINEPGSSIMPGKVNPTQAEALSMVCVQVMGNDTAVGVAASQGNFELNVYMPVIIHAFLQSIRLLSDSLDSFNKRCLAGIEAEEEAMSRLVEQSVMLVTALSPHIGYDNASRIAKKAHREQLTLKEAAVRSGLLTAEEFDRYTDPGKMV
ncbi:class II fumarate hydratase [Atopococcus tabaci]|uniref:class II fumarate hydratase n=1 Tax=Atopococcus tabaci TaxID=269774 RepID=UPI0004140A3E|nr:class II fumarate hydratase [Atopococcus tabaci]